MKLYPLGGVKNKPNTNPIQSQYKPNPRKAKDELKKCYNNELQRFCPDDGKKANPIQTRFKPNFTYPEV